MESINLLPNLREIFHHFLTGAYHSCSIGIFLSTLTSGAYPPELVMLGYYHTHLDGWDDFQAFTARIG